MKLMGEMLEKRIPVTGMLFGFENIFNDVDDEAFMALRLTSDTEKMRVGETAEIDIWAADVRQELVDIDPVFAAGVDLLMANSQLKVVDATLSDFWVADNAEIINNGGGATFSGIDPSGLLPNEDMQLLGTVTVEAVEPGLGLIATASDTDPLTMNLVFGHNEELSDNQVDYGAIAIQVDPVFSATNGTDVNWSGNTDVFDALTIVEYAEFNGLHEVDPDIEYPIAMDVDGDTNFTPLDVMLVVDAVYQQSL
jgi:hypothetical protein